MRKGRLYGVLFIFIIQKHNLSIKYLPRPLSRRAYRDRLKLKVESSGSVQTFTAPVDGWYSIDVYGARGGNGDDVNLPFNYSNGGRTYAEFQIKALTNLYVYVGQASQGNHGGWNGGAGVLDPAGWDWMQSGGGGGTDVRFMADPSPTSYLNMSSINSRIIVAGGGGGAEDYQSGGGTTKGGNGGGWQGGKGTGDPAPYPYHGDGGTQTSGYAKGQGGPGTRCDAGGGGGGYWGGFGGNINNAGGGGSSYVSGNPNCVELSGWRGENSYTMAGGHNYSGHYHSNNTSNYYCNGNGYAQIILEIPDK